MGKCLSYCENTIRWGFKGKGKMMKKIGVEGINEGWSGGLLSLRGGRRYKIWLKIYQGKENLRLLSFFVVFSEDFSFYVGRKKSI